MTRHPAGTALSLVLLLLAAAGCRQEPPPEEPLRPVRVMEVYAAGGQRVRSFSGTVQAGVESTLSFKVAGTIQWVGVKVGDVVQAGQQIAQLDPTDYELQVEDARASLELARAQARNARARLERTRELYESNNASQAEYDAALAEEQSARAQVDSSQKRLELAQLQLGYTRLKAPVDGAVTEVPADVNENVSPGQPIAVLASGSRDEVEVAIPEVFITRIREGQKVEVSLDSVPDRTFPATVREVGVAATGAATTYPVTVQFDERTPAVRPGMAASASFRFSSGNGEDRIIVPPYSVGEDEQGRFVFIVEPEGNGEGIVHRRAVRVGELTGEGLEIRDGLQEGDLLITAGVSRIQDGLRVKVPGGEAGGA